MSIILSLLVFSVLVLIHEFGHFLLAKKNGIGVTEFSLGMGPRIASIQGKETRYSWKLIPFGGSCMMVGEDEESSNENAFNNKSVWARIAVVAAGPIFNFILALVLSIVVVGLEGYDRCRVSDVTNNYGAEQAGLKAGDVITEYDGKDIVISRDLLLYSYMNPTSEEPVKVKYKRDGKEYTTTINTTQTYSLGVSYTADDNKCKVNIVEDSPSAKAGLKNDDVIVGINDKEIKTGEELYKYMTEIPLDGSNVQIKVMRNDKEMSFTVSPKKAGYTAGFSYDQYRIKTSSLGVLRYSLTEMRYDIESTFKGFQLLFTGKLHKDDVAGPVGIVKIVGDNYNATKSAGAYYVFLQIAYLTILFSVNLGMLNLFPFPALDGGRLVFLFIEAIRGKPVPREKEAIVHFAGMVILMIFMVLVLINDVQKLF